MSDSVAAFYAELGQGEWDRLDTPFSKIEYLTTLRLSIEGLYVGDARKLDAFGDNSFDALLVMGPLYHLSTRSDRLLVLKEARRVLKSGGRAIMTYLNCWGLIRTGLTDFPEHYKDPQFVQSMFHEGGLGIWYWSNPDLAQAELAEAGFRTIVYAAAEGFAGGMQPIINRLAQENPCAYDEVLKAAVESSELARYRDATEHIKFVVT